MKKILVVVESIDANDSSGTKGRVALINNLADLGFNIKVYHYTRRPVTLVNINCVSIDEQKINVNYIVSKIQLLFWRWLRINSITYFEKLFGFSFAYNNDVNSIKKALQKEKQFQPDWVLTLSKGASFRTHKALLGIPNWHGKWLAYVHDPFPHHFYPRPYNWVEPGYYQKQEFFREVSKKCRHAIFPSQLLKEWMGSYYPDFLKKGVIIPHQIDETASKLVEAPNYFQENKFTVLHAGSLMKQREPNGLVNGFIKFLKLEPEAVDSCQLLLIGRKDYHQKYLDEAIHDVSQVYSSSGYVQYEDVLAMQYKACVNVIMEAKAEISPFLPGKFPHCVKADKPILYLGPAHSESLRLLGKDYPYAAEIDDENLIAKHLQDLYHIWRNDSKNLRLHRPDLESYLSKAYLKKAVLDLNYEIVDH